MANDSTGFFNWYRRYKVRAADMNAFQEAMIEGPRGLGEGSFGAAILSGFQVSATGGFTASISGGIANGATGYLHVNNSVSLVDLHAATGGSLPNRSLLVCTPVLTGANNIPSPTSPFSPVPLNTLQQSTVVLIPGTPALNPAFPSKGPNDVIICGLLVPPGAAGVDPTMLDFEVRESIGENSLIAQNQVRFDNRLRAQREGYKTLRIHPSQNVGSSAFGVCYPARSTPSSFPLSGGLYNAADTFADMTTGVISGGDTTSSAFTPTVPTGNSSIVCSVVLNKNDTLSFIYGIQGTRTQCLSAIQNQRVSGAGAIGSALGAFVICYVIVSSVSGSYSDMQVLDARPFLGGGSGGTQPSIIQETLGTGDGLTTGFVASQTPQNAGSALLMLDGEVQTVDLWSLSSKTFTFVTAPGAGQVVSVQYVAAGLSPITGTQQTLGIGDGSTTNFTISGVPANQQSVLLLLDGVAVLITDWSFLQGGVSCQAIFNTAPAVGQVVSVFYFNPS